MQQNSFIFMHETRDIPQLRTKVDKPVQLEGLGSLIKHFAEAMVSHFPFTGS